MPSEKKSNDNSTDMRTVFRGSPFNYSYIQIFIYDKKVFEWKSSTKSTFLRSTKSRFSQVYVSGLDEVDRVMILEETNIYIVYILNYYIL